MTLKSGLFTAAVLALTVVLGASECRAQTPFFVGNYVSGRLIVGTGEGVGFGIQTKAGIWEQYAGGTPFGWHVLAWDNNANGVFTISPYQYCPNNYLFLYFQGYWYNRARPMDTSAWQYRESGWIYVNTTTGQGMWASTHYNGYTPSALSWYAFAITR